MEVEREKAREKENCSKLALTVVQVLTSHHSELKETLSVELKEFSDKLLEKSIISQAVSDSNDFHIIIKQFKETLKNERSVKNLEVKCRMFLSILQNLGGPIETMSNNLKHDMKKEVNDKFPDLSFLEEHRSQSTPVIIRSHPPALMMVRSAHSAGHDMDSVYETNRPAINREQLDLDLGGSGSESNSSYFVVAEKPSKNVNLPPDEAELSLVNGHQMTCDPLNPMIPGTTHINYSHHHASPHSDSGSNHGIAASTFNRSSPEVLDKPVHFPVTRTPHQVSVTGQRDFKSEPNHSYAEFSPRSNLPRYSCDTHHPLLTAPSTSISSQYFPVPNSVVAVQEQSVLKNIITTALESNLKEIKASLSEYYNTCTVKELEFKFRYESLEEKHHELKSEIKKKDDQIRTLQEKQEKLIQRKDDELQAKERDLNAARNEVFEVRQKEQEFWKEKLDVETRERIKDVERRQTILNDPRFLIAVFIIAIILVKFL